jgi:hypothetical protein
MHFWWSWRDELLRLTPARSKGTLSHSAKQGKLECPPDILALSGSTHQALQRKNAQPH